MHLTSFSATQKSIIDFFVKFQHENTKITEAAATIAYQNDKMPSPYSSAQGTYIETVFEKILTNNSI